MRVKQSFRCGLWLATASLVVTLCGIAQQSEEIRTPFSNPNQPGRVEVSVLIGSVSVEGYAGKEVLVSAHGDGVAPRKPSSRQERDGLRRVGTPAGGFSVEEQNNVLRVSTSAMASSVDLRVKVPLNSAVKVKCLNCKAVTVNNLTGGLELENINGRIEAIDVAGSVIAHSLNDKVVVRLRSVDAGSALSFSSMNGEVDVTVPGSAKADFVIDNLNGEIFTDFELELHAVTERNEKDGRSRGGSYRLNVNRNLRAKINGGGSVIRFRNHNGDILIRKSQ